METEIHYQALEKMYLTAPISSIFKPQISVSEKRAEIEIEVDPLWFHAAGAVHGSVYFKMLDDAAYFAASSIVVKYFVLTASFTTRLTRPISSGRMRSIGRVVKQSGSKIIAEADVLNGEGQKIGSGKGTFVQSKLLLADLPGYDTE
jgi:uncharacterized protein (TIGR00369 family)